MSLTSVKSNNVITNLKNNLIAISFVQMLYEVLKDKDALIEDLNVEQLDKGLRFDGSVIDPKYSPNYAALKASLGFNPEIVNLELTGDFKRNFKADIKKFEVTIRNSDNKTEELKFKYGDEIIGLSSESVTTLLEDVIPDFSSLLLSNILK